MDRAFADTVDCGGKLLVKE